MFFDAGMIFDPSKNFQFRQCIVEHSFRYHTLNNVRSIETINAVSTENAVLRRQQCPIF